MSAGNQITVTITGGPFRLSSVDFGHDGVPQSQGIDSTILASGQTVTFTFTQYTPGQHAGTFLEDKHQLQLAQVRSGSPTQGA